jgi:hypothetical protein
MSEIPADIMDAAEEALDNLLCNCSESCGGDAGLRKASIEEIAKAILAERNRSAAIVDENALEFERQAAFATDGLVHDAMLMASDALELAASAIREGGAA